MDNLINCLRWIFMELGYPVCSKDTDHIYGPTFEPMEIDPVEAFLAKCQEHRIPARAVQKGEPLKDGEYLVALWGLSRFKGFCDFYYYDFHVALLMENGEWHHKAGVEALPSPCDLQVVNKDYEQEEPFLFAIKKRTL